MTDDRLIQTRVAGSANRGKRVSEAEFRRLWKDKTKTLAEVGRSLGISQVAVSERARTRGLGPRGMGPLPAITDDAMFTRLWVDDVTEAGIAAHFGVSVRTVRHHRARIGLPPRGTGRKGMSITLAEWKARQLLANLARSAAQEQAAMISANMADSNLAEKAIGSKIVARVLGGRT